MNIKYKIIWIDDTKSYYENYLPNLNRIVSSNNLISDVTYYQFYDEYKKKELDKFDKDIFNRYDLLLIDYSLSGMTGADIISDLRNRDVFTDVVFYSSNYDNMKNGIRTLDQLDGVFLADRETNLFQVIENVIKKNLKRNNDIVNIRGLLLDATSDFDFIVQEISIKLFDNLPTSAKEEIINMLQIFINNARNKSNKSFDIVACKTDRSQLKAALQSVEYVMDNKDRYFILQAILEKSGYYSLPSDGQGFATTYEKDIIKPRNDLAHKKLFYGDCGKKIQKATLNSPNKCEETCNDCSNEYDINRCENIRKLILKYYQLFTDFENKYAH